MRGIIWDGSLSLGHPEIDGQHERLVALINRLAAAWNEPDRREAVMRAVTDMYLYANEHFREEEALMAAVGYPACEAHAAMHRNFTRRASAFADASLADEEPFQEMLVYLTGWLVGHIKREDARISEYLRSQGRQDA